MKYVNKDLIQAFEDGDCNVILHQCNCTKGMGAGIAKKIAEKYPLVGFLDYGLIKTKHLIGNCYAVNVGIGYIINLYSQYYVVSPSNTPLPIEKEVLYDNFQQRIKWLRNSLQMYRNEYFEEKDVIGLPLIASGLASDKKLKGDMTDLDYFKKYIAPIIEEELKDLDVTVYYIVC